MWVCLACLWTLWVRVWGFCWGFVFDASMMMCSYMCDAVTVHDFCGNRYLHRSRKASLKWWLYGELVRSCGCGTMWAFTRQFTGSVGAKRLEILWPHSQVSFHYCVHKHCCYSCEKHQLSLNINYSLLIEWNSIRGPWRISFSRYYFMRIRADVVYVYKKKGLNANCSSVTVIEAILSTSNANEI